MGHAGPLFPGGGQPAAGDTEQDSPGPDGVCTQGTLLDSSSLSCPSVNPAYTCRLCQCTSYKAGPHLRLQVLPRLITKASLCSGLARCPPMESRPPSGPGPHIRGVYTSQKEPRFHPDGLSAGSSGRVCSKTLQAGVTTKPLSDSSEDSWLQGHSQPRLGGRPQTHSEIRGLGDKLSRAGSVPLGWGAVLKT